MAVDVIGLATKQIRKCQRQPRTCTVTRATQRCYNLTRATRYLMNDIEGISGIDSNSKPKMTSRVGVESSRVVDWLKTSTALSQWQTPDANASAEPEDMANSGACSSSLYCTCMSQTMLAMHSTVSVQQFWDCPSNATVLICGTSSPAQRSAWRWNTSQMVPHNPVFIVLLLSFFLRSFNWVFGLPTKTSSTA